jgi:hypothetical protein
VELRKIQWNYARRRRASDEMPIAATSSAARINPVFDVAGAGIRGVSQ